MSVRGDRTREHLLDVAEQLFGQRGVSNVSLREIRIEAGQANVSALQYHFGDREGLVRAVAQRHLPRLAARHEELVDELATRIDAGELLSDPGDDPARQHDAERAYVRELLAVVIRPQAEYIELGSSERSWVKISAELMNHPRTGLIDLQVRSNEAALDAGARLFEYLVTTTDPPVPQDLAVERLIAVIVNAAHSCADRSRLLDSSAPRRRAMPHEVFVTNLIDMSTGALLAPMDASLLAAVGSGTRAARQRR